MDEDEDEPDELDALEGFDLPDDDGAGWEIPVPGLLEKAGTMGSDADRYEMRFEVSTGGHVLMRFVRRRVSDPPPDGTVCHVDTGDETGYSERPQAAIYRDGQWTAGNGRPLKITPRFWIEPDTRKQSCG